MRGVLLWVVAASLVANDARAQMWFFPDTPPPAYEDAPDTWISGTLGRGLNDSSGKLTALGLSVARTGRRAYVSGSVGYLTGAGGEATAGAHVGVNATTGRVRLSAQGGVGWISIDAIGGITSLRFPLGVAIKTAVQTHGLHLSPWIMGRLNLVSVRGGGNEVGTADPGVSGGIWMTGQRGIGLHVALDALFRDEATLWMLSVGMQWNGRALRDAFR